MDKLAGYFTRSHVWNPHRRRLEYVLNTTGSYSMVLTKAMFMRSDYLFIYSCLLPSEIHAYIDTVGSCEDIAMNFLVSGLSASPPIRIHASIIDAGTRQGYPGLSAKDGFGNQRDYCLGNFTSMFSRNTLLLSSYTITSHIDPKIYEITRSNWTELTNNKVFSFS